MESASDFILTLDTDWAPDFMIDNVAQILIKNKVKTTWFVTHRSDAIEKLKENKELFELGIHPNMLSDSSHGKTEDEVLKHILEIVPDAVSMRTHNLYQTSPWLFKAAKEYGISIDVSLLLPRAAYLSPHKLSWKGMSLWRIPYFWEDDIEMYEKEPIWKLSDERLKVKGLKVFDFHPIHVVLNTSNYECYEKLKNACPMIFWNDDIINEYINRGLGPRSIFLDLVQELSGKGKWIKDIANEMERE